MKLAVMHVRACWTLALALGCGGDEDRNPPPVVTGIGGADTEATGEAGEADDGERLDTPSDDTDDGPAGGDEAGAGGCKKVDLLFVIDNSGSMEDEQANLIASFPGFIDGIQNQLADTEGYHVGITTSDLYFGDASCVEEGALITQTQGDGASNMACGPYMSGLRYMNEEDDLATKFACAAQVGIGGDGNERPMQTLLAAVDESMVAPGGCNEGFVRDDALLVVVVITDEEDDHEAMGCVGGTSNQDPQPGSAGEPPVWFDQLVSAKGGDESSIVVLSLVGPEQGQMCPELQKCDGGIEGAEVTHRIIEFTEMFTYGFVGPVCEPYGPFFADAIGHIKSACDDFVPVG